MVNSETQSAQSSQIHQISLKLQIDYCKTCEYCKYYNDQYNCWLDDCKIQNEPAQQCSYHS